jgi:short-subunit dehydrogenase
MEPEPGDREEAADSRNSRVALITGASSGIGSELARELVRRGDAGRVVLTARRADRLKSLANELVGIQPNTQVLTVADDLADDGAIERIVSQTMERFGGIDVLINNAGLGLPTLFADSDPKLLERQLQVNFVAPLLLTRQALPSLVARGGMVINIGSAITSIPNSALGAYGATKAGLAYWNDAIRRELRGCGVTVCLVEPGPVRTEFTDASNALVASGTSPHASQDLVAPWMTAEVSDVARRVANLVSRPRRRLSVRRRMVYLFRALGLLCRLIPPLGDAVVARLVQPAPLPADEPTTPSSSLIEPSQSERTRS